MHNGLPIKKPPEALGRQVTHHIVRSLVFFLVLLAGSGCFSGTDPSPSPNSTTPQSSNPACSFTQVDQFSVNVDPTQDFSVSNIQGIAVIRDSNCSGLRNQILPAKTFSSVTNSDGHISVSGSGGTNEIFISDNQATTPASALIACEDGILATGTLQKVELDAVANQIRVAISWTLIRNGCTQTPSVSGMSAPVDVEVYTYSVPDAISSSPFYMYMEYDPGATEDTFKEWSYTNANASFSAGGYLVHGFQIGAISNDHSSGLSIGLNVPGPDRVIPGSYTIEVPTSTTSPSFLITGYDGVGGFDGAGKVPGFWIASGDFQILSVTYGAYGDLLKLVATFTVHSSSSASIRGAISYDVTKGFLSPQTPTDTTSPYLLNLQGNLGNGVATPVSFNQTNGTFSAVGQYVAGGTVNVNYKDSSGATWELGFKFPNGVMPAPGAYGFPSGSSQPTAINQQATLSISSCSPSINVGSSFNVFDAQYDSNGVLVSFVANFSQNCGSNQSLAGTVRYNQP